MKTTVMRICQTITDMGTSQSSQWLKVEWCEQWNIVVLGYKTKYRITIELHWYKWLDKQINKGE